MNKRNKSKHTHKYKNILLLIISLLITYLLSKNMEVKNLMVNISLWGGYLGAFLSGILFVSTFTVSLGALILFFLSQNLPHLPVAIIAALGAVIGDLLIFRFIKDSLMEEITPIYEDLGGKNHI